MTEAGGGGKMVVPYHLVHSSCGVADGGIDHSSRVIVTVDLAAFDILHPAVLCYGRYCGSF